MQEAYLTSDQATEVTWTYTLNGKRATLTDAKATARPLAYDGHDRLRRMCFPPRPRVDGAGSTTDYEQYGYDPNGNVTSRRLRDGTSIAFTFDPLNRVTLKDVPAGAYGEADVAYSLRSARPATERGHVGADRGMRPMTGSAAQIAETNAFGIKAMAWDPGGRIIRLTHAELVLCRLRLSRHRRGDRDPRERRDSGQGVLATFTYDELGRRTLLTRGNGTMTSLRYDDASRLISWCQDLGGTADDMTVEFARNPANQIVAEHAVERRLRLYRPRQPQPHRHDQRAQPGHRDRRHHRRPTTRAATRPRSAPTAIGIRPRTG